ncbi:MAG: MotA/TolQ/ExbB proton channel family protein [bacterium]
MDIISIIGFIVALSAIYFGAPDIRHDLAVYLDSDSFIFVFFGSIGSMIIASSKSELKHLGTLLSHTFRRKKTILPKKAVEIMVKLSKDSQQMSKQDLPNESKIYNNPFLNNGIAMIASGLDENFINTTLNNDLQESEKRHDILINKVRSLGAYATMFGMAGTVIGVIQVLRDVKDINNIISGLSLALLTTLYGLFLSSIFYLPLSKKLKNNSEKEVLTKLIIKEGILGIARKEIPVKINFYLKSFLDQHDKKNA